jgi:hypothetical protein
VETTPRRIVSIQESVILQELTRLVRDLVGRIRSLEQRSPSRDPWPADILERLERLERMAGRPIPRDTAPTALVPEFVRRNMALEAGHPLQERNAARRANAQRLREAIARILEAESTATATRVLQALGAPADPGGKLPSLRTIRWHLQALRGNGNSAVLP